VLRHPRRVQDSLFHLPMSENGREKAGQKTSALKEEA